MKKLWIVVVLLLVIFSVAMAQTVHWADQKTVEWNVVTNYVDGDPVPPEFLPVVYRTWIAQWDGAARITGTETMLEEVPGLEFVYTIPDGIHDPGVQAVVHFGGYSSVSTIEWGSEQLNPFLLGKARNPAAVEGFRIAP